MRNKQEKTNMYIFNDKERTVEINDFLYSSLCLMYAYILKYTINAYALSTLSIDRAMRRAPICK